MKKLETSLCRNTEFSLPPNLSSELLRLMEGKQQEGSNVMSIDMFELKPQEMTIRGHHLNARERRYAPIDDSTLERFQSDLSHLLIQLGTSGISIKITRHPFDPEEHLERALRDFERNGRYHWDSGVIRLATYSDPYIPTEFLCGRIDTRSDEYRSLNDPNDASEKGMEKAIDQGRFTVESSQRGVFTRVTPTDIHRRAPFMGDPIPRITVIARERH